MDFKSLYTADIKRYTKDGVVNASLWQKKFHYYLRKAQTEEKYLLNLYYRYRFKKIKEKHGIELSSLVSIGAGLYVGHPYNITVNAGTVIGKNCNIHKGVLLGQENRGKRKGTPVIGNNVWIGVNACIVGNVHIGDDVLIAANSFVNCDVPEHSIVFGNPCIIKPQDGATTGYINNCI